MTVVEPNRPESSRSGSSGRAPSPDSPSASTAASPIKAPRLSKAVTDHLELLDSEESKKRRKRQSTNMRNWGDVMKLQNGATLLEKGLASFVPEMQQKSGMPFGGTASHRTVASAHTKESADDEQVRVKARRGLQKRRTHWMTKFDNLAEEAFNSNFENPWFMAACMDQPLVQRYCNPAEYERRNRSNQIEINAVDSKKDGHEDERVFGLPKFEQAGYTLLSDEDADWIDERVPMRLGMRLAIHKKTSVERFCFMADKSRIPAYTSKEQMLDLAKKMKKCDHVNMLTCKEVCEDEHTVYFFYENFPCITLLSILEDMRWTQEQIVNLVRECCAAVAYCTSMGLSHLGWTLCHVLLPVTCLHGDPMVAKIFGFGLMGAIYTETYDKMCWAPEALEAWNRAGDAFCAKMEAGLKAACDFWSLGTIIYTLVARRPPILGQPQVMMDTIIARKWGFTVGFDEVDNEAKKLVEGLLEGNAEKRTKQAGTSGESTLRNEWIRRRYRPPRNGAEVFAKLEEFCHSQLPKRLFGRFLVKYLDAEQMRQIAIAFYSLDTQGDGVICTNDVTYNAKEFGRPKAAAKTICEWLASQTGDISLGRFAECMAEDVIDGSALRHAFESLDDDGSEEISAQELYNELSALDSRIQMSQVLEHIQKAEEMAHELLGAHQGSPTRTNSALNTGAVAGDHKIDFTEFVRLFPVRVKRLREMKDRVRDMKKHAEKLDQKFSLHGADVDRWIRNIEDEKKTIENLCTKMSRKGDEKKDHLVETLKEMQKHARKVAEMFRLPPGPADWRKMDKMYSGQKKKKKVKNAKAEDMDSLGYDSWLQDHAVQNSWNCLFIEETRLLKTSQTVDRNNNPLVDIHKAHDAGETINSKIDEVIFLCRCQYEEYKAFCEVLNDIENPIPIVTLSGRGLQRSSEGEENAGEDKEGSGEANEGFFNKFMSVVTAVSARGAALSARRSPSGSPRRSSKGSPRKSPRTKGSPR